MFTKAESFPLKFTRSEEYRMSKLIRLSLVILIVSTTTPLFSVPSLAGSDAIATVLSTPPSGDVGTATTCAVCGMKLHVKKDTPGAVYNGKDYYFCDESERDSFVADPQKFVKQK